MEFSWEKLFDAIAKYKKVILATIIDKKGSTPRGIDTSMIVLPDGSIIGTIGGGPVENEIINYSLDLIKKEKNDIVEKFFTGESVICGGKIIVLLEYYCEYDIDFIKKLVDRHLSGENIYYVRHLNTFERKIVENPKFENENIYIQKIVAFPELLIFGAGHIALPLSKMASLCDFNVYIYDDRKDFVTKERFPEAKKLILCDFNNISEFVDFKNNSFIVLVTREHAHDEILLKQILGKPYKYLGMIGSKKRVNSVKQKLIKTNFKIDEIEKIHAPIGLKINSETPAEIAISILAEIIQVKNSKFNNF